MRTRNFEILQKVGVMSATGTAWNVPNLVNISDSVITSINNTLTWLSLKNSNNYTVYDQYASSGAVCLWVGTNGDDNTLVAGKDYCSDNKLKAPCTTSEITSNSVDVLPSSSMLWEDDKTSFEIIRAFTANTSLTIKEVGLVKSTSSNNSGIILLDRTVLPQDKWITVSAGQQFSVSVVVEC